MFWKHPVLFDIKVNWPNKLKYGQKTKKQILNWFKHFIFVRIRCRKLVLTSKRPLQARFKVSTNLPSSKILRQNTPIGRSPGSKILHNKLLILTAQSTSDTSVMPCCSGSEYNGTTGRENTNNPQNNNARVKWVNQL